MAFMQDVAVDTGSGFTSMASGTRWALGATVLATCYNAPVTGLQLRNPTTNAWTGSVEYSEDVGSTYSPLECSTCSVSGLTYSIVVDGNGDGANQASTQCLNGATCTLVTPSPAALSAALVQL